LTRLRPQAETVNVKARLRAPYAAGATDRDEAGGAAWRAPERQRLADLMESEHKTRLLEIGAGSGHSARHFADLGLDVVATDLSPEHIALCRNKGLTAYVRAFYDLRFPTGHFNAIWAMNCLLHVPSVALDGVLHGIRDVLADTGVLIIGLWGGTSGEGVYEDDSYTPHRFFALQNYSDLRERVFTVEKFSTVQPNGRSEGGLHIQIVRARRE
jgi:SAM-dependent methyltransferase